MSASLGRFSDGFTIAFYVVQLAISQSRRANVTVVDSRTNRLDSHTVGGGARRLWAAENANALYTRDFGVKAGWKDMIRKLRLYCYNLCRVCGAKFG